MTINKTKICCKCEKRKTLSEFNKHKNSLDGLQHYCKECNKKQLKKYYLNHQKDKKEQNKIYYQKNKKQIIKSSKKRNIKLKIKYNRLYGVWLFMKERCYNKNCKDYSYYGGRNITVCKEWRDIFINFYNWAITHGHQIGLQIDRINNDKGYYPENCRFITQAINSQNRSTTKLNIKKVKEIRELCKEDKLTQKEIAQLYGIEQGTISNIKNNKRWLK